MRGRKKQDLSQKETPPVKSLQETSTKETQEWLLMPNLAIEGKIAEIFVSDTHGGYHQHFPGKVLSINSDEIIFERGKIILKDAIY